MFGRVERGPKFTSFYVEVIRQQNNLRIFRRFKVSNVDLEEVPTWYGHILNRIVHDLDQQLDW